MNIENLNAILLGKNANDILKHFDINCTPIDIKTLIRKDLNINIKDDIEWDKLALDGSVYLKNGYPEIWINITMPEYRQNFTLAHELGHIINDILPNIEYYANNAINDNYATLYRGKNYNLMEKRANNFAVNFLMPSNLIAKEARDLSQTSIFKELNLQQVIQRMADRFRVSFEAMKWRLINLGYINKK